MVDGATTWCTCALRFFAEDAGAHSSQCDSVQSLQCCIGTCRRHCSTIVASMPGAFSTASCHERFVLDCRRECPALPTLFTIWVSERLRRTCLSPVMWCQRNRSLALLSFKRAAWASSVCETIHFSSLGNELMCPFCWGMNKSVHVRGQGHWWDLLLQSAL